VGSFRRDVPLVKRDVAASPVLEEFRLILDTGTA
jgi:hypothetical protein